jgi:hypothetical protein
MMRETLEGLPVSLGSTLPIPRKPVLRINFADFWGHFDKTDNYFWHLLSKPYELELSTDPDFLIYSAYGREFAKYDCFKIFYTGENLRPDLRECDFAFSFDYLDSPRHYRLPLYALYADNSILTERKIHPEQLLKEKTKFCNFIVSNGSCEKRNNFFRLLSKYKKVDSAGRFMNNVGRELPYNPSDKWDFIKPYKFTIAFENSSYPGYTTEKIFEPLMTDGLPIYWGNPLVDRDFNPRRFLSLHSFHDEHDLIDAIVQIDRDDELFLKYLSEPAFPNDVVNAFVDPHNVLLQFEFIFSHKGRVQPISRSHRRYYSIAKGAVIWGQRKAAAANDRLARAFRPVRQA